MDGSELGLDEEIESLERRLATLKEERRQLVARLRKALSLRRQVDDALRKAESASSDVWHSLPSEAKRRILERVVRRNAKIAENPAIYEEYVAATLKVIPGALNERSSQSEGSTRERPTRRDSGKRR